MKLKRNLFTREVCLFGATFLMLMNNNSKAQCNGSVITGNWVPGVEKLYSPCPEVKVGIGTDSPKKNLHLKGITCSNCPLEPVGPGGSGAVLSAGNSGNTVFTGSTDESKRPKFTTYFRIEDERRDKDGVFIANSIWDTGVSASFDRFFINRANKAAGGFFSVNGTGSIGIGQVGTNTFDKALLHLINADGSGFKELDIALLVENDERRILQLDNDGLLRAREIKVDEEAWADYVFKPNYDLMPLNKVKEFIAQNGHLPNVPSAEEIESDGVNLGETAKITMEKVEELTLYVIDQQEQLDEQKELLKKQAELIEQQRILLEKQQQELDTLKTLK